MFSHIVWVKSITRLKFFFNCASGGQEPFIKGSCTSKIFINEMNHTSDYFYDYNGDVIVLILFACKRLHLVLDRQNHIFGFGSLARQIYKQGI